MLRTNIQAEFTLRKIKTNFNICIYFVMLWLASIRFQNKDYRRRTLWDFLANCLRDRKSRLIFGYTEDVSRFNYGFVHGSKTKIGNLIVGWNEASKTIVVVPTVPDLSGCGDPTYYRRSEILKAYRNKYPTDAFIIYPDRKGYIGINAYDWLEDEKLYVYVSQDDELAAFTDFFMNTFATK